MKNIKKAVAAIASAAVLLAACGNRTDQGATSGEMVAPEVSSQDLLVSSLEYLLLDNEEDTQNPEQQDSQDQEAEAPGSQDTSEESENLPKEEPQPEENAVQGEEVIIYYGRSVSTDLQQETVEVEEITPDELINALARHNIVSLDTRVLSFEQREQDGASILYLDFSKALGEYLGTMSGEAESIIVSSVINTFLENYGADAVCLAVEGKPLVTSNADYSEKLKRCTPEELIGTSAASDPKKSGDESGSDAGAGGQQRKLPLTVEKE